MTIKNYNPIEKQKAIAGEFEKELKNKFKLSFSYDMTHFFIYTNTRISIKVYTFDNRLYGHTEIYFDWVETFKEAVNTRYYFTTYQEAIKFLKQL